MFLGACQIRCPIAVIWTAFIGGLVAEKEEGEKDSG